MTGIRFDENGMIVVPDTTTTDTSTIGPQFDENGMLVVPAAQPAPAEAEPQGDTSGAAVAVTAETEEGAGFLEEAYRAVVGGVRDGAQELGETVQWAVDPRIKLVQKVITGYREKARAELLKEYPEIKQQVRSQHQELSRNARWRHSGMEAYSNLANQ